MQYLDESAYRVINGAVAEVTALLKLRWDLIFYTVRCPLLLGWC